MTLQYPNLLINGDALSHVDLVVLKIMRGSNPQIRPPDTLEQNPWASDVVVNSLALDESFGQRLICDFYWNDATRR